MGIAPRTLTTQDISRLAVSAKAKMRLEQPVTLVTVRSRFAIQSILTRELLVGFMRRWERNLRWDRSRPYTAQQYIEECYKMRKEGYKLLTRICKEHGVHTPVNLEKKEPFRSFPAYRAVPSFFG